MLALLLNFSRTHLTPSCPCPVSIQSPCWTSTRLDPPPALRRCRSPLGLRQRLPSQRGSQSHTPVTGSQVEPSAQRQRRLQPGPYRPSPQRLSQLDPLRPAGQAKRPLTGSHGVRAHRCRHPWPNVPVGGGGEAIGRGRADSCDEGRHADFDSENWHAYLSQLCHFIALSDITLESRAGCQAWNKQDSVNLPSGSATYGVVSEVGYPPWGQTSWQRCPPCGQKYPPCGQKYPPWGQTSWQRCPM